MHVTLTHTINAPLDTVWNAFDDPKKLKQWQPSLVSMELCEGEAGQAGAVSKLTYREGGREIVLMETITERRKPHTFTASYTTSMMDSTIENTFTALDGGRTEWAISHHTRFRGAWRFLGPLTKGIVLRKLQEDAERFTTMVEDEQRGQGGGAAKWVKLLVAAVVVLLVLRQLRGRHG